MRIRLIAVSFFAFLAMSISSAHAQYRKDRDPNAQVKVVCPAGTCGRLGGGVASGLQFCSAANCKKKAK